MVQVAQFDSGFKIGKKSIWAPLTHDDSYVSLMTIVGDDMEYDTNPKVISYPGEYDVDGVQYRVRASKKDELNYSIITASTAAVICQTKQYLRQGDLPDDVDTWIFTTQKLADERTKMELEGEVVVLENFGKEE